MHQEREHRKYSPSQADRFFLCPGSVKLLERIPPRPSSSYAIEGTKAHEVIEAGLRNGKWTASEAIDESIHCAEDFDSDFKASVNDCLLYVKDIMDEWNKLYGDPILFIETTVRPPITSAPGEADGHCDIAIYSAKARTIYVIDYKHGVGVSKAAEGNRQIKQYGAGFLFDERKLVDPAVVDKVVLVIVQPRAFHVLGDIREYETTPGELFDYLLELEEAIERCEAPDAPLCPGEEQCKLNFCDARFTCPALEKQALAVVSNQFASVRDIKEPSLPNVSEFDVERLSYAKKCFPMLESFMRDVDKRIDELLREGIHVPDFKLVESSARREYYGEETDRVEKLTALIGCQKEELYTTEMKTLTEVEKLVINAFKARVGRTRKKQAAEDAKKMFAYFTIKQSTGNLTVVSADDPRPPVNRALTTFSSITGLIEPPKFNPEGE